MLDGELDVDGDADGVPEGEFDGLLDFDIDGEGLADGECEVLDDGVLDADGLEDGVCDGLADGDDEGLSDGDAEGDGLLEGEVTSSGTTVEEPPRQLPDSSVLTWMPSNAHLFVDCSQIAAHTPRMRGYTIIARPLVQFPLART